MSVGRLQNLMADCQFRRRDLDIDPSDVYALVFATLGWTELRICRAIADKRTSLEAQLLAVHSSSFAVELVRAAVSQVISQMDAAGPEE